MPNANIAEQNMEKQWIKGRNQEVKEKRAAEVKNLKF